MLLTELCLNPSIYFSITHTTLWSFPFMNSRPIFTSRYPTIALASKTYTLLTSSLPPSFYFVQSHIIITYVTTHHTHPIFFPYMVFECRHNIWNQLVSTAIPSPNSFRDITTTGTHQNLRKILKCIFFWFFSRQYGTYIDTVHTQILFYSLLALVFILTHKN